MSALQKILTTCTAMIFLISSAVAAEENAVVVGGPAGAALRPGVLYVLNYRCQSLTPQRAQNTGLRELFSSLSPTAQTAETFGFYLYKGSAPVTGGSAAFNAAAGNVLGVEHVYTRDAGRSATTFMNTGCSGQFVIKGSDTPSIMAYVTSSRDNDKQLWAGIATLVTSSMGPLSSLLGTQVPPALSSAVASGSTLLGNYQTFLEILDNTRSASQVVKLRQGHLRLATSYAAVEIDVTPVTSLLLGRDIKFRDALSGILQPGGTSISAAQLANDEDLTDKCNAIANAWLGVGLTSPIDLAYVMVQQLLPSGPDKHQLVQCLGAARAQAALPYLHLFRMVAEMRYTQADIPPDLTVNDKWGPQPHGWVQLGSTAKSFIKQANRLAGGIALATDDAASLAGLLASELQVTDQTEAYELRRRLDPSNGSGSSWTASPMSLLERLSGAGLKRWACYVETGKSVVLTTDHHDALVLLALFEDGDRYVPMTVHVLFNQQRQIAEIVFSDDLAPSIVVAQSGCMLPTPAAKVAATSVATTG